MAKESETSTRLIQLTIMETNIIKIQQTMTSLEIAELTGKQHKNVMQAIRNMELAWEKVHGLKFQLIDYKDRLGRIKPCYQLTKTECLYIATAPSGCTSRCGHPIIAARLA